MAATCSKSRPEKQTANFYRGSFLSQGVTWAPYPEFEVCNPDTINTSVNTVVPGENGKDENQKTRYVMENMSAPCAGSSKSNELYNIKSTMHGLRGGIFFFLFFSFSPRNAPVINILITHSFWSIVMCFF